MTIEESRIKAADYQRAKRATFNDTQCVKCGKPRISESTYCQRCYYWYWARLDAKRKGRPEYVVCRRCGTGRPSKTVCKTCNREKQRQLRALGRKKVYEYKPDGRVTFCEKCVSEKLVNAKCESCARSASTNWRKSPNYSAWRKAYRQRPEVKAYEGTYQRQRYLRLRTHLLAQNRAWWRAHPQYSKVKNNQRRALVMGANGTHSESEWLAVLAKYRHRCVDCGLRFSDENPATEDHTVPFSRGGSNFAYNLKPMCQSCNSRKRNRVDAGLQHSLFDRMELAR